MNKERESKMNCGGGDCPSMEATLGRYGYGNEVAVLDNRDGTSSQDRAKPAQRLDEFFEFGKKIPRQDNFEFVENVVSEDVGKLLCGMLNCAQGGSVFVGIDPDGTVKGKLMDRGCRDAIRLTIDKLNILPVLFASSVKFVPVKEGAAFIDEVYVAKISCSPSKFNIFATEDSSFCYYRLGRETVALTRQDVWTLMIKEKEESWCRTLGDPDQA